MGWLGKGQEWGPGLGERLRLNEWRRLNDEHGQGITRQKGTWGTSGKMSNNDQTEKFEE